MGKLLIGIALLNIFSICITHAETAVSFESTTFSFTESEKIKFEITDEETIDSLIAKGAEEGRNYRSSRYIFNVQYTYLRWRVNENITCYSDLTYAEGTGIKQFMKPRALLPPEKYCTVEIDTRAN